MTSTGERKDRTVGAWALAALATVLVACGLLLLRDGRYFFYGDTQSAYYGWWYHLGEEVRAGRWPVLDPHAWRAGNIVAEGQWGLFSPLSIGVGLLATLTGNVLALATTVKIALVCAGSLGMFLLARSYAVPPPLVISTHSRPTKSTSALAVFVFTSGIATSVFVIDVDR